MRGARDEVLDESASRSQKNSSHVALQLHTALHTPHFTSPFHTSRSQKNSLTSSYMTRCERRPSRRRRICSYAYAKSYSGRQGAGCGGTGCTGWRLQGTGWSHLVVQEVVQRADDAVEVGGRRERAGGAREGRGGAGGVGRERSGLCTLSLSLYPVPGGARGVGRERCVRHVAVRCTLYPPRLAAHDVRRVGEEQAVGHAVEDEAEALGQVAHLHEGICMQACAGSWTCSRR